MGRKHSSYCTLPNWLIVIAIITIIMGVSNWGIVSAVSASVGAGILICGLIHSYCKRRKRKKELSNPFDIYLENKDRDLVLCTSNEIQHVHITLEFKTKVYVQFIGISFRDMNDKVVDIIDDLYDWNRKKHLRPENVEDPWPTIDGIWHWRYKYPHRRILNQRITICIQCKINESSTGNLRVGMSCVESKDDKILYLPYKSK